MHKAWYLSVVAACLILVASAGNSIAQVGWLNPEGRPGVQIEGSVGSFSGNSYEFPSGSTFLTARTNLWSNAHLIAELPLFVTQYKSTVNWVSDLSRSGIANPYIGIEIDAGQATSALLAFGLRLPAISERNNNEAIPAGLVESQRSAAFAHDLVALSLNAGYRRILGNSGFGFRATGGGQMTIPVLGNEDLIGDLATNFWYQTGNFRLMTTFGGLLLVTERGLSFGDRLALNLGVAADITPGAFQPGVHVRVPIDNNVSDFVSANYGVHLAYLFAGKEK